MSSRRGPGRHGEGGGTGEGGAGATVGRARARGVPHTLVDVLSRWVITAKDRQRLLHFGGAPAGDLIGKGPALRHNSGRCRSLGHTHSTGESHVC